MFESLPSLDGPLQNPSRKAKTAIRRLTRISHELSATVPDPSASAAFRFVGLLDVPSSTPPVPSGRAPCSDGVSDSSRRKPVRNAGQPITEAVWMNPHIGLPSMCSMSTVWRRSSKPPNTSMAKPSSSLALLTGQTHRLDDASEHTSGGTVYNTSKHHPPGNGIMEYCPTENALTGLKGGLIAAWQSPAETWPPD